MESQPSTSVYVVHCNIAVWLGGLSTATVQLRMEFLVSADDPTSQQPSLIMAPRRGAGLNPQASPYHLSHSTT